MRLDDIGFYTLCDERCENLSGQSPMWRCELIVTDQCQFTCPYCRGLPRKSQGSLTFADAARSLALWCNDGLKHVRFSGGEPTCWPHLPALVEIAAGRCERVAVSTNGAAPPELYRKLVAAGVDDFSVSLDSCCAAGFKEMSGGRGEKVWRRVIGNIEMLASQVYVSVGVVLTDTNLNELRGTVQLAHDLGVADIRIIPAAQAGNMIRGCESIPSDLLKSHPILAYRVNNVLRGRPVRGIDEYDSHKCFIPIDDSVIAGQYHFPCVIYMREGGNPIGPVGPDMRRQRVVWSDSHDSFRDPICRKNCLDVCIDYNNKCAAVRALGHHYSAAPIAVCRAADAAVENKE